MRERDPRALLGLSPDATRDEAQRAFRKLAKATHPDAGGTPAAFRAIASAWAELAPTLPSSPAIQRRVAAPSPHVLAYRPTPSRVLWTETRPSATQATPEFASVLDAAMARAAA